MPWRIVEVIKGPSVKGKEGMRTQQSKQVYW